jgi:signal transduction histidine kinase
LETDVRAAIDELRETLRSLRTGVDEQRPLAVLGTEIVERFSERASVPATFVVVHPDERLPIPIENELLRIMQEALTNIDRHARAQRVEVVWAVHAGNFELTIRDDGSGFQPGSGVRDSAYGLVGMRERADVIGALLAIDSAPGHGTTIRVTAGLPEGAVPTGPTRSIGQTVAGTGNDGTA